MFKKLKSLFVIEEGDTPSDVSNAGSENSQGDKKTTPVTHQMPVVTALPNAKGQIQDKFLEVLFSALQSNNQQGFDYLEFKDFLRSLANVPMDDSTRFKSAFATAQTMGATKEKILTSAKEYINLLAKEEAKFKDALDSQKEKNLTGKQDEIKNLEKAIQENEAEIDKLKTDIEDHRKQIVTLENEINTASDKIAQTAGDFGATYQALLSQIQDDVKNIESHL